MEVVLFVGLQGSGKSTFYRSRFASTHILVSKDLLRNNRRPQARQMFLIEEALREGRSVVVDNTNPTVEDRAVIIALARRYEAEVAGYVFDTPIEQCLARNAERLGKARVPDAAVFITRQRLRPPTLGEGFDRLHRVRPVPDGQVTVERFESEGTP
ncbi:AAA family ATPase [Singulisphaera rosea]